MSNRTDYAIYPILEKGSRSVPNRCFARDQSEIDKHVAYYANLGLATRVVHVDTNTVMVKNKKGVWRLVGIEAYRENGRVCFYEKGFLFRDRAVCNLITCRGTAILICDGKIVLKIREYQRRLWGSKTLQDLIADRLTRRVHIQSYFCGAVRVSATVEAINKAKAIALAEAARSMYSNIFGRDNIRRSRSGVWYRKVECGWRKTSDNDINASLGWYEK